MKNWKKKILNYFDDVHDAQVDKNSSKIKSALYILSQILLKKNSTFFNNKYKIIQKISSFYKKCSDYSMKGTIIYLTSFIAQNPDYQEDVRERQILSSYRLGICKTFEKEKNIKSNIVKEMNDKFYKIYSQGDPESIKNICKSDTLPEDYEKIILKNREEGNEVLSLCGKTVKMSYLQCQRIERKKCESNMIFLGFVFYRSAKVEQNPGYS